MLEVSKVFSRYFPVFLNTFHFRNKGELHFICSCLSIISNLLGGKSKGKEERNPFAEAYLTCYHQTELDDKY